MPSNLIEISDQLTHLTLAPAIGGSLVNWTARATGQPLLRHNDQQALNIGLPGKLGCYPLAPWSNRIAKEGFDNPDGWLALTPNSATDPFPIHGSAWQQAWQVVSQTANEVVLEVRCETPFTYRAEQRIGLNNGELSIELRVTHLAEKAAWHGLGLHPYFPRQPDTRLQASAAQVWSSDTTKLPTGLAPVPPEWDFQLLKALPEGLVDNGFCQWDGHCRIEQPELGYALECQASGADYFLLYCPPGLGFFCIEPVSHPVNAHHLPGKPGLKLLEQGQSTHLDFTLKYIPTVGGGLLPPTF
ncbi:putative aldose-1-epimerase [Pseudomonas sp. 31 E 6]|uniref:aldose 1-epimerase n=1 Tax=unclassified Pseudomonas TaxID=196821 RepID=UPI000812B98D|nr:MULTISPECIES: aldose 1-epimerase [unclassified Pseudomonas]CRM13169.1 putative aldose-1-epimerase [Pseudomonas sp. 31 E 6]CRM28839.1 putative aldose-1-epimerase [Pseudomonas sp. 31 E 5]